MKVRVTGDIRTVANSAWVSTLDEVRVQKKDDKQVEKLVSFLVDNHHTSPFEAVTITLELSETDDDIKSFKKYISPYSHYNEGGALLTIDLHNFIKISVIEGLLTGQPWKMFKEQHSKLAIIL